jgi:hypothetical protein
MLKTLALLTFFIFIIKIRFQNASTTMTVPQSFVGSSSSLYTNSIDLFTSIEILRNYQIFQYIEVVLIGDFGPIDDIQTILDLTSSLTNGEKASKFVQESYHFHVSKALSLESQIRSKILQSVGAIEFEANEKSLNNYYNSANPGSMTLFIFFFPNISYHCINFLLNCKSRSFISSLAKKNCIKNNAHPLEKYRLNCVLSIESSSLKP